MNKKLIKKFLFSFAILLILAVVLLTLVNMIDNEWIIDNYNLSIKKIETEGYGWSLFRFSNLGSCADNATDYTMLGQSIVKDGVSAFKQVFDNYGYSRYWHGYLVVLKPLLLLFDLQGVRRFNMIVFYGLFAVLVMMLKEKTKTYYYSLLLCLSFVLAYIYIIPISMQFFSVFVISMSASIYILSHSTIYQSQYKYLFFFIIGCLTSFFDFLTAPIITVGLPLFVYMLVDTRDLSIYERLKEIILLSASWGIGYGLFWIAKWILSSLVLGKNIIADGLSSVSYRMNESNIENFTRIRAVTEQIKEYFYNKKCFLCYMLCFFVAFVKLCLSNIKALKKIIPNLFLALYPLIWYFVVAGHSYVHKYMTYRGMIVFLLATSTVFYHAFFNKDQQRSY